MPIPFEKEQQSIDTAKLARRLFQIGKIDREVADRVASILRFIPRGAYREMYWPATWLEAGRLLGQSGFVDLLREVAYSSERVYLGAVGALQLAKADVLDRDVISWLKNRRDYSLLAANEREELLTILQGLPDSEEEIEYLNALRE